MQRQGFVSM